MESRIFELKQEKQTQAQIIGEIELLVNRYLESIEFLSEGLDYFEKIPTGIQNVSIYWKRLKSLILDIEDSTGSYLVDRSFKQGIQNELQQLEKLYAALNQRIQFFEKNWTPAMWESVKLVLMRIDTLLEAQGKDKSQKDRLYIQKLLLENDIKKRQNFLSSRAS
jgi:hypothetical protein